jgi:hypothetical protein
MIKRILEIALLYIHNKQSNGMSKTIDYFSTAFKTEASCENSAGVHYSKNYKKYVSNREKVRHSHERSTARQKSGQIAQK